MSIELAKQELEANTKKLVQSWQVTKNSWRDVKSMEFEQTYIDELASSVGTALSVMENLRTVMAKLRNDCA